MRARLTQWSLNIALVLFSTAIGFVIINASFPFIFHQSIFPRALVQLAGGLQYTLYPDTYDRQNLDSWIAIVGDSYGQGAGDSFVDGDANYSITHYLRERTRHNYLIFARNAFDSIRMARELVIGVRLMNDSPFFPDLDRPTEILIMFYEGNDLNDTLLHLEESGTAGRKFGSSSGASSVRHHHLSI